jgi:hypothetical protein
MTKLMKSLLALGSFTMLLAIPLWSQGGGSISGIAVDPSGAVVVNAAVEATNTATGISFHMNTTSAGTFFFPTVGLGTYTVKVTAAGFGPAVLEGVVVALNQNTNLQITLRVGEVQQTVEVTAAATQLQAETAQHATGVDNRTYDALPISLTGEARNPFAFMLLLPGVNYQDNFFIPIGGITLGWNTSINGSQFGTLSLEVDGSTVMTSHVTGDVRQAAVPVDAVSEFTMISSNYSAQYGTTGGGIMTLTMKSGTNEFHGKAYEYLRNDKLDARGFFAPSVPKTRQNEYGANVGGPIRKDKTFFFGYWSGFKDRVVGYFESLLRKPLTIHGMA